MVKRLLSRAQFAREAGVTPAAVTKACAGILKAALDGKRIDANHPDAVDYLNKGEVGRTSVFNLEIDPLYNDVVDWCDSECVYSINSVQKNFKVGYARASAMVAMMGDQGIIPEPLPKAVKKETPVARDKPHVRGVAAAREKKKREYVAENDTIDVPDDIQVFLDFTLRDLIDKFGTDTRFLDWLNAIQKIELINEKRLKNAQTEGRLVSRDLVKTGVIDTFNSAHLRLLKDGAKSISAGVISKHQSGSELSEIESYVSDVLGSFIRPVKNKIIRAMSHAQP